MENLILSHMTFDAVQIPVALFGPFWTVVQSKTGSTWENSRLAASHVWKGPELGFDLDIVFCNRFSPLVLKYTWEQWKSWRCFCHCRYGEQAAQVTNEGLDAAGYAIGTAWAVFKIRKAINPKSVLKPTTLAKAAAKANSTELKAKQT
jgi:hypothetical protein